jgi:hypothetical protein
MSNGSTSAQLTWLPRIHATLEQLCSRNLVPYGVAIGWIEVESGGRLGEVTSLDERGYFQLMPDESKALGVDHLRLSTDSEYSLQAGFKLIGYYRTAFRKMCSARDITCVLPMTEYYWRVIKMAHSMGQGSLAIMLSEAVAENAASDWASFSAFLRAHDAEYLHRLKHSPVKWLGLIDRMFTLGQSYGTDRLVSVQRPAIT